MNTAQLSCALYSDRLLIVSTKGVFAADQLPKRIKQGGFIANTDVSYKPGKHWCAFYFDGSRKSEFFDSFGQPPDYYNQAFLSCLYDNSVVQMYNSEKLQGPHSNVCRQYCLYVLIHRIRGQTLRDIIEKLLSIQHRYQYVYGYVLRVFPYCFEGNENYALCNQTCTCLNLLNRCILSYPKTLTLHK